jgi:hypothetical protein
MLSSFLQNLFPRGKRHQASRPARRKPRPALEPLERRELLTAYTPGNLVLLQAGIDPPGGFNGTAPLFLNEYRTDGTLVQSKDIPNTQAVGGPGNQPITIDLSAAAGNGQLNRSYDGSVLTFGGVDAGINSTTATGSADRVIAIAGKDPAVANFLDTTTHGQFYVGDDNRGAIALTATGPIWAVGHPNQAGGAVSQGVHYFPTPGPSFGTQVSNQANIRGVTIGFDGRLYYSTAGSTSAGLAGIYTEAQPLPTIPNPTSDVPVVSALFSASKLGGIFLADVNGTGVLSNGDKLYFLDDGTVGGPGTGGLYVSTYDTSYPGNHWSTAVRLGDAPAQDLNVGNLRGLAGTVISPTEVDLYTTAFDNKAGNTSYVQKWVDTHSGVNIASASEVGNLVTITLPSTVPFPFASGQTVVVDGIPTGLGGTSIVTDGYNGSWHIMNVDPVMHTFQYMDTNVHGTGLATVTGVGAADVAVTPTTIRTLANGSVTIGGMTYAAQGLRGVAFAPVDPTTVTLTFSPGNPLAPGTPVTFTATLTNPEVTPAGVVTFIDQKTNTVLGQGTITTSGGVSTASFTTVLVGNHTVKAYFAGGGTAALPSALSDLVTVIEAGSVASATGVVPNLGGAAVGLPVTLTASVIGIGSAPTGAVCFYDGSVDPSHLIGSATVGAGGTASVTAPFATAGVHNITAVYNGDNTYAASQGATTVTVTANAFATFASSANNVPVGSTPTYTVTLTGNPALGTPGGSVQFFLDGVALGSPQTLTPGPSNTATASVPSTALTAGSHFVTVAYTAPAPYQSFRLDTTTATNGVAYIETAQQDFAPGDLIAVQRGDGTVNLGSSGYLVFLDEYRTDGTLVQKIALPNLDAGPNHALLLSGQNGAEGLLNRSADGYSLTLAGYDVPVGQQFVTSTFPFQYARTIALVNGAGNVDTSTAIRTGAISVPYNPLDVVTRDGNEFWLVSNLNTGNTTDSGILYVRSLGASRATQVGPVGTSGTSIALAGGQLYAASTDVNAGSPVGVWQVGVGQPTASTALLTLPGLQDAYQTALPFLQNPKQLLFFNHNDGTSNNPDTLFIADQSNGLLKFFFDSTTQKWVFGNGSPTTPFGRKLVFGGGATGVTGFVVNPGPNAQFQLYVTGSNVQGQNPNQIASLLDTNAYNAGFSSGSFATLAFVGATGSPPSPNGDENFAGLAFAPGYHTTTLLSSSAPTVLAGVPVTFTATVTATSGTPGGSVTFYDGTTALGTVPLTGGVATFMTSTLALGARSITAVYNGDVKDGTSTSAVLTETVGSVTKTKVSTSNRHPSASTPVMVTLTATVTSPGGVPTGSVQFYDDLLPIGAPVPLTGGVATVTVSTALVQAAPGLPDVLTPGLHSITAVYTPDLAGANTFAVSRGVHEQAVAAQAFGPGDLFVLRVGDGTTPLVAPAGSPYAGIASIGSTIFVDEYTPAGALVQSIILPTADGTGGQAKIHAVVADGLESATGQLSLSGNGHYLFLTGYDSNPLSVATAPALHSLNTTPRAVARISANGTVQTIGFVAGPNGVQTGGDISGVSSPDGDEFFVAGADGISHFAHFMPTAALQNATDTTLSASDTVAAVGLESDGINLYALGGSGPSLTVGTVGGGTVTPLPGIPGTSSNPASPIDAYFTHLDGPGAPSGINTAYIADGTTITKWSFDGMSWSLTDTIMADGLTTLGFYWLAGETDPVTGMVTLYATYGAGGTGDTGGGQLYQLTDAGGWNQAFSSSAALTVAILLGTSQENFRGVAFGPS